MPPWAHPGVRGAHGHDRRPGSQRTIRRFSSSDVLCRSRDLRAASVSVPVLLVRLAGRRDDQPHLEAFRAAHALIAPFPAAFESQCTPDWVATKTTLSRIPRGTDGPFVRTTERTRDHRRPRARWFLDERHTFWPRPLALCRIGRGRCTATSTGPRPLCPKTCVFTAGATISDRRSIGPPSSSVAPETASLRWSSRVASVSSACRSHVPSTSRSTRRPCWRRAVCAIALMHWPDAVEWAEIVRPGPCARSDGPSRPVRSRRRRQSLDGDRGDGGTLRSIDQNRAVCRDRGGLDLVPASARG